MRRCSCMQMRNFCLLSSIALLAVAPAVGFKCAGFDYPFGILPQEDHFMKFGSSLDLYCMLNVSHPNASGRTSDDLYFYTYENKLKLLTKFTKINDTTIHTVLRDLSLGRHNYYCALRDKEISPNNDGMPCLTNVQVGYEPEEVKNFSCKSWNWEKLVCEWHPPDTYLKTVYKLKYSLRGRAGRIPNSCPNGLDVTNNTCIFTHDTDPPYRQAHEYFKFELTGENPLGNCTTTINFHHYAYVVPNKPENIVIVNKTLGSALLNWSIPYPMQNFPPGLKSKIEFKSKWDLRDKWNVVYPEKETGVKSKVHLYNLTGLDYAHTLYDVRIYLKSNKAEVGDLYWSEPGTETFITPSTIPGRAPRTTHGSFDIVSGGNGTDVFVYWNRIPEYMENGDEFGYNVTCLMNNKHICDLPIEKTLTYARYAISDDNEYLFTIYSVNNMGRSRDSSHVFVPKFRSVPQPESFTKVSYENGVHELSWKPVPHKNLSNYTIFWCEDDSESRLPCRGVINWIDVEKNTTEKNITIKSVKKFYKFAIAANLNNGASSGMIWSSCVIFHDKTLKEIDVVRIAKIESREVDVAWEIRCAQSSSFGGFSFYYCPVNTQNDACQENQSEQVFTVSGSEKRNITLKNLKPYTTYKLQMSIIFYDGARQKQDGPKTSPKRFTTLEDAPSEPLNVREVNVTNSSIALTWKVPQETNGILQIYNLFIESDGHLTKKKFDAKNSADDSLVTGYEITGLSSHTPYTLSLEVCTSQYKCSKPSPPITVVTRIGVPGKMLRPQIAFSNSSMANVTWERPFVSSGYLNYYELSISINGSYENVVNFTGMSGEILLPDCNIGGNPSFRIRAINIDGDFVYKGPWSDPTSTHFCASVSTGYMALLAWLSGICVFSVVSVFLFYLIKRGWLQCTKMKDVEVKLPPGLQCQDLEKDNQDYVHLDRWPPRASDAMQGSLGPGLAPDEESLLGKKSDESLDHMTPFNMVMKNGGDSSGCSVGRESVSSSVASDNHASSDSGAEADQCMTPSMGLPFGNWDSLKLEPKSLKECKTRGQSKKVPGAEGALNYSNLNDWSPADPAAPGYTRVGFTTDSSNSEKSLPGKGYVAIASIAPLNLPQKTSNESNFNVLPLDNFTQFFDHEPRAPESGTKGLKKDSENYAPPCYLTLACLQEHGVDESSLSNNTINGSRSVANDADTTQTLNDSDDKDDISVESMPFDMSDNETETEARVPKNNGPMPPYVSMIENPGIGDDDDDEDDVDAVEEDDPKPSPVPEASNKKTVNGFDKALVDGVSKESESYSNYIPHRIFGKESLHT